MSDIVEKLLASDEPSVRYQIRVNVLGEDSESSGAKKLRRQIQTSPRVQALLSERDARGRMPHHPYNKWRGGHWVLTALAELGYPPGDVSLEPIVDAACAWALGHTPKVIQGRPRRCASQEGNALLYMIRLGFIDERCDKLAERLLRWQWADGGWNCDKRPEACHASFHESLIPMRALNAYAQLTGSRKTKAVVKRAAEMFLDRRLFRRKTTGEVINPAFARTHYPYFWQYTFLHALMAMAEAGLLRDRRCNDALDLLESKRVADGGFPAEQKYYSLVGSRQKRRRSGQMLVDWGGVNRRRINEWVTVEALRVLSAAGRLRRRPQHWTRLR